MSRKKKLLLVALVMAGVCALPLSIAGCKNKGNNGTNITEPEVPLDPEASCKHEHMSHEAETDSNCSTRGHQEYWYCSDCNKYYTDAEGKNETTLTAVTKALDLTRHNYGDWVDAEPATCSETGLAAHYECEDCHHYFDADYTEVTKASLVIGIDAEAHDWKLESETPATCTADGLKTYVCNHDHAHTKTEAIKANGHQWSVGHVVKKATCTEKGILSFTCTVDDCGATKTEDIPALGHDWTEYEYVAAEGVYKRTCKHSEGDDRHEACAAFETIVAGSSEQYYIPAGTADELKAALEKGGYIKLTADIEVADGSTLTVAKAANLDLNNHEIKTNSGESILINTAEAVVIRNGKISTTSTERAGKIIHLAASSDKVTLSGLTVSGVSGDTYYGIYGVRIEENANAQITGCNLSGLSYAIALSGNGAKVTVNGGSIKNSQVGVAGNGKYDDNAITLTDLTVNAVDTAVYNPQGGTTIITGGTYTAEIGCALEVRAGAVTVTNATLAATGEFSKAPNGSGTTITGTAIGVSQHTTDKTIRLTVSGSSLSGVCAIYEKDLQNDEAHDAIKILLSNDNTINGCVYSQNTAIAQNHLHVTEAWVYNPAKAVYEKVCDNCGEVAETLAAGTEEMPCLVNDAASLKVALENGGIIKLTADVSLGESLEVTKDTTLDLGTHTLNYTKGSDRPLKLTESNLNVTIKNGDVNLVSGAWGFVDFTATSSNNNVLFEGLKIDGSEVDNGSLIKVRTYGNTVELKNLTVESNWAVLCGLADTSPAKGEVNNFKVTGGTYTLTSGNTSAGFLINARQYYNMEDYKVTFDGVTINTENRLPAEIVAATAVYNNCTIGNPKGNEVGFLNTALAVSCGGKITVNGGTYTGKRAAHVYNSGGTIEINGGTFIGDFQADVSNQYKDANKTQQQCYDDAKIIVNETETAFNWNGKYAAGGSSDTYKSYFIKNVSTAAGLTEAVKTNGTVVLNADITADVVIAKGLNVTLDLNGHTLENDKSHTIVNHGTLNLIDSKGNGKVYNGTHAKASLANYGVANVDGVTLSRTYVAKTDTVALNSYYTILNGEDTKTWTVRPEVQLTLTNVTASCPEDDYSSLVCNKGGVLSIVGGKYTTKKIAVKNDDEGTLTINGGEFSGNQSVQNWGVATINGGKFNNDITTGTWSDDFEQPVTTINGGEYNGLRLLTVYNTSLVKMPVLKVKGAEVAPVIQVSGGEAAGFSVETSEDGEYNVYALKAPAFVSNSTELQAALNKGGYVKLLNDIDAGTYNVTVDSAEETVVDLGGYTITGSAKQLIWVGNKNVAKATFKNGKINATTQMAFYSANGSIITLENVNVESVAYGIYMTKGTLNVIGGKINAAAAGIQGYSAKYYTDYNKSPADKGESYDFVVNISGKTEITSSGIGLNLRSAKLKISDAIINTTSACLFLYKDCNAVITDCKLTSIESFGVAGNGTARETVTKDGKTSIDYNCGTDTVIEVNNCTINALIGIYHPQIRGKLTVNGGVINGVESAVEVRAGEVTLNNVQLESTSTEFAAEANGNGTTTKGVALAVSQHTTQDKIVVNVNGTELNGIYALYEKDLMDETTPKDITININEGNRFYGCVYSDNCKNVDKVDANLGEWTYADGNYTREDGATVVAGSSECFPVLVDGETALMAVLENGGYVKLTDNVTTTQKGEKQINKKVIVDLNGKTLTCVKDSAFAVVNGGELSFVNGNLVMSTSANSNASIAVEKGSSVTLDGATLTTNCYGIFPAGNAASVTVKNNSVIRSTGATCISTNSNTVENYNVVITVEDSILYGFTEAVILNVPGKFNAKNSQFYGINEAVFVRAGTAKLENCILQNNINGVDENGEPLQFGNAYNGAAFNAYYDITNTNSWGNGSKCIPLNTLVVGSGKPGYSNQVSCELVNCTLIDGFAGTTDKSNCAEGFKHHLIYATTDVKDSAAKATVTYDAATAEKSNFTDSNVKAETGSNAKITPVTEEEVA